MVKWQRNSQALSREQVPVVGPGAIWALLAQWRRSRLNMNALSNRLRNVATILD
jgi:hypothetical protein